MKKKESNMIDNYKGFGQWAEVPVDSKNWTGGKEFETPLTVNTGSLPAANGVLYTVYPTNSTPVDVQYHNVDWDGFQKDLKLLINSYSLENNSNTPDFILAKYLVQCLFNFNITSNDRETWYGKKLSIGST